MQITSFEKTLTQKEDSKYTKWYYFIMLENSRTAEVNITSHSHLIIIPKYSKVLDQEDDFFKNLKG